MSFHSRLGEDLWFITISGFKKNFLSISLHSKFGENLWNSHEIWGLLKTFVPFHSNLNLVKSIGFSQIWGFVNNSHSSSFSDKLGGNFFVPKNFDRRAFTSKKKIFTLMPSPYCIRRIVWRICTGWNKLAISLCPFWCPELIIHSSEISLPFRKFSISVAQFIWATYSSMFRWLFLSMLYSCMNEQSLGWKDSWKGSSSL